MSASRVACVNLPHIAVALEERDTPALVGRPFVVESPRPGPRTVHDRSRAARLAGVTRGMSLSQARKVCPEISVLPARIDDYRDTFRVLLDVLGQFTPRIEPADFEHSWLATEGLTSGPGLERSLATEMVHQIESHVGLPARVGLAHGKLTSRIVAEVLERRDTMVLPPGKERAFLGGLPTYRLPMSTDNHQRLALLGLTKVHQYAALPARGILPRFGYEGLRAYQLSHGRDDARVHAWREEPFLEVEDVFLDPIVNQRSLSHYVERLAHRLSGPLAAQFRMAGAVALVVTFENGETATEQRTLVEPVSSPASLLVHLDALSARLVWPAPVERLKVSAQGLCPTVGRQVDLFRQEHETRAAVERALGRIQTRFGPETVCQGRLLEPESPLPERRAYAAPWGV
jgi:DNA polymerase-4